MEIFYSNDIEGGMLRLDAEESGHCVRVLRHREGDAVDVIDGRGTLLHCTLLDADPKGATARIDSREPGFGAHPYRLTMAVCPTKNIDRYEWFAEKATEIGMDVLAPVIGDRSERKVLKTERLERLVKSAAKQSLKGAIPEVLQPQTVRDFILGAPEDAVKMICYCFDGPKRTVAEVLRDLSPSAASSVPEIRILIGPEGDFSPEEADLALSRGWVPVTLGASRLRTETAALVAATMVYSGF
jgi:16S rRNA (uracil1498-N3)-methyltransferase